MEFLIRGAMLAIGLAMLAVVWPVSPAGKLSQDCQAAAIKMAGTTGRQYATAEQDFNIKCGAYGAYAKAVNRMVTPEQR